MELKDVNVGHGEAGTLQDFGGTVRWPAGVTVDIKQKAMTSLTFDLGDGWVVHLAYLCNEDA